MADLRRHFDPGVFLSHVTTLPGIYQMRDSDGKVVYVGKAKNLRKRLSSYFRTTGQSTKTRALMAVVVDIDTTATQTEIEALLLENNLIKRHRPKFNILLRDDKSYPYIHLSDHPFPRISLHRGARKGGQYFGPYPNVQAVRHSLDLLQKVFRVRQCEDSYFANRSRPCLHHQIGRCYAPCVGNIGREEYAATVEGTRAFLQGQSETLLAGLAAKMQAASERRAYEQAALLRDQLIRLRKVTEKQNMIAGAADCDVLAVVAGYGEACVHVMFYRNGHNVGAQSYYPRLPEMQAKSDILQAFIGQFYLDRQPPKQLLLSHRLPDMEAVSGLLEKRAERQVALTTQPRKVRRKWLEMAGENARLGLGMRISGKLSMEKRFHALAEAFAWDRVPQRLECADISHTQGADTIASCVVFDRRGAVKSAYRRYRIGAVAPGDDCAAMRQVLTRRFARLCHDEGVMPDVFFVDGGRGQLRQAMEVFTQYDIQGVHLIAVAKGQGRKAGLERFWFPGEPAARCLAADSPALQLIVQIRDEAHRFAIGGHRAGRGRKMRRSLLEEIPGIGGKRRQALLGHFGGLAMIEAASVADIARVSGISAKLAEQIYATLHEKG